MQSWLVHMRTPVSLFHDLGPRGFAAFQLLLGGAVLAALVHPIFLAVMAAKIAGSTIFDINFTSAGWVGEIAMFAVLSGGYLGAALLAICGLRKRGMRIGMGMLLTIPLYWILLSAAAWRALGQLIVAPHRWEKTEHGLAKTSLRANRTDSLKAAAANRQRPQPHRA